jgi:hypothetical protein
MAEIVVLWILCRRISAVARQRKRDPFHYQVLLVALWILGEFLAAVVGVMLTGSLNIVVYIIALIGAVIGSSIAFKRVSRGDGPVPFTPDWRGKNSN